VYSDGFVLVATFGDDQERIPGSLLRVSPDTRHRAVAMPALVLGDSAHLMSVTSGQALVTFIAHTS